MLQAHDETVPDADMLVLQSFCHIGQSRLVYKHLSFLQGSLQEQEDSEPDSSLSQSPNVQDWLSQARSTRTKQHHDRLLQQRV